MSGFAASPLHDADREGGAAFTGPLARAGAAAAARAMRVGRHGARRAVDALLGHGRRRGAVLQSLVAGHLYAVCMAVAVHGAVLGVLPVPIVALLCGGMLAVFVLHYGVVRSGLTEHLPDPSLGTAHLVVNITLCVAGYVLIGPLRGNLLILVAETQLYAMFRLRPRQLVHLGWLAGGLLTAAACGLSVAEPAQQPWVVTATHLGVAWPTVMAMAYVTQWIAKIRERLDRQASQLRDALAAVEQLATHDALTGLLNRRAMDSRLAAAVRDCRSQGRPLSLALLDLDHFKQINDRHGHAAGDAVLVRVAEVLARACPQPAVAARWGGEEFLVAWPGLAAPAAADVLGWVRQRLQRDPLPPGVPAVTLSAGLAQQADGEPLQALIERADAALYRAKRLGRDRVERAADRPAADVPVADTSAADTPAADPQAATS